MIDYIGVVRHKLRRGAVGRGSALPLPFALQWGSPVAHDSVHAQVRALPPIPFSTLNHGIDK
jgi:hypothetical protein